MIFRLIRSITPWAVATGAIWLSGCGQEATPAPTALRPVKTAVVESGADSIRNRVFSGSAQSAEEAALSFKVSGSDDGAALEHVADDDRQSVHGPRDLEAEGRFFGGLGRAAEDPISNGVGTAFDDRGLDRPQG
ncbi:MAG: hypothetical protein AAFX50_03255, partial [Acidobacteriota bacterium]